MDETKLTQKLNSLWAGVIKNIDIDLNHLRIKMDIDLMYSRQVEGHTLSFEKVRAFFFSRHDDEYEWRYSELTEIFYYPKTRNDVDRIKHLPLKKLNKEEYVMQPNFCLSIWSSDLLIQADAVIIDDDNFQID